jgi:PAS domain S-box-containing protein
VFAAKTQSLLPSARRLRRLAWLFALAWTLFMAVALVLRARDVRDETHLAALAIARAYSANDPHLTLMNPVIHGSRPSTLRPDMHGVTGRITSLEPAHSANAPDSWERNALLKLAQGGEEVAEFTRSEGSPTLRLMRPMVTRAECINCHAEQADFVGKIRGGVGISVPLEPLYSAERRGHLRALWMLGPLWVIGLGGIAVGNRIIRLQVARRQQVVDELQRAHDRLQQESDVYRDGPVVVFQCRDEPGWPVVQISANVAQVLGHEASAFLDGSLMLSRVVHEHDLDRLLASVATGAQERSGRFAQATCRFRHRDGSVVWVLANLVARGGTVGGGATISGYFIDITDWRRTETDLRESEERLDLALTGAELGVWDWDLATDAVVFDVRWAAMLGHEISEIPGTLAAWSERVHPDDMPGISAVLKEHLEGRTPIYRAEFRMRHASGGWVWILDTGKVLVRDADGRPLRAAGVHQDITRRKRLEKEAVQQERLAAVGQLAAGIAHDFNNILCSILGFTELLQTAPGNTCVVTGEPAAHLRLEPSRGASRAPDPRLQPEDDASRAAGGSRSLRARHRGFPAGDAAGEHPHGAAVEPGSYLMEAEPAQLQQLITNLAINARDAMPDGGALKLTLRRDTIDATAGKCAHCGQSLAGPWLRLDVADTGTGIAVETLPLIFEPFFTTKAIGDGTGLGLSQAAGIAAQHGGHFQVHSEVGGGTTFTLLLPQTDAVRAATVAEKPAIVRGAGQAVLVVEDEPSVRDAITAMLRHLGYRVTAAGSGRQALDLFAREEGRFDLVLTDVVMPDLDGEALCRHLRELAPAVRVVAMSGYPLGARGVGLLDLGAVAWVQKPITIEQLAGVVADALGGPSRG